MRYLSPKCKRSTNYFTELLAKIISSQDITFNVNRFNLDAETK